MNTGAQNLENSRVKGQRIFERGYRLVRALRYAEGCEGLATRMRFQTQLTWVGQLVLVNNQRRVRLVEDHSTKFGKWHEADLTGVRVRKQAQNSLHLRRQDYACQHFVIFVCLFAYSWKKFHYLSSTSGRRSGMLLGRGRKKEVGLRKCLYYYYYYLLTYLLFWYYFCGGLERTSKVLKLTFHVGSRLFVCVFVNQNEACRP